MKGEKIMTKNMEMIFTKEEMARITEEIRNQVNTITVDLHGLRVDEARRFLRNILALNREECDIQIIHGYHGGTALKEMVRNHFDNPRIKNRKGVKANYGRTVLKVRSAA